MGTILIIMYLTILMACVLFEVIFIIRRIIYRDSLGLMWVMIVWLVITVGLLFAFLVNIPRAGSDGIYIRCNQPHLRNQRQHQQQQPCRCHRHHHHHHHRIYYYNQ